MARNRIIYQSLALFAGPVSGAGTINQLTRVQSWDSDFSRNFKDINQYGQLGARDRIEIEAPTVNMKASWYPTDGSNEDYVGLTVSASPVSVLSGILKKETDTKNYYLLVADEGSDAVGSDASSAGAFGLGNTFLTSYSLEGSVGDVPTASANFEALNFAVYANGGGGDLPSVNPENGVPIGGSFSLPDAIQDDSVNQSTVLRPGDIDVTISGVAGFSVADLKIQKFTLSLDLKRTPLQKLGSRYAFSREVDFPLTAKMSVDANLGDLSDFNLADLLCETGTYNLTVTMKKNDCSGQGAAAIRASLKGAKLVSESVTTDIGKSASSSLSYEVQIGGPEDLSRGVFLSGSYA